MASETFNDKDRRTDIHPLGYPTAFLDIALCGVLDKKFFTLSEDSHLEDTEAVWAHLCCYLLGCNISNKVIQYLLVFAP